MILRFEGTITVRTPLCHFGNEKTGSSPVLRTIFMMGQDGIETQIPYISGNSIRGKLRRALMHHFLETSGANIAALPPKLYHMFFTGGALESTDETYACIDLPKRQRIRDLFPPISLYGCAIGNQMIPGKLKVGNAFPICSEYAPLLPDHLKQHRNAGIPAKSFTDDAFHTRKDDLHVAREKDEQAVQMKVDYEVFIPGTVFYHWFMLEHCNDIEAACFGTLLDLFTASPFLGGKSSTGNGEVVFAYTGQRPDTAPYTAFCKEHSAEIRALLAELGGGK